MIGRQSEAGFSTIEVLVALVILTAGLIPLMQTQLNIQQLTMRLQQADRESAALNKSLRYMRDVNPGEASNGTWRFEGGQLSWSSRRVGQDTSFDYIQGLSWRRLSYYSVSLEIVLENGTSLQEQINKVGWQIRQTDGNNRPL